jgi:hypothetical protein
MRPLLVHFCSTGYAEQPGREVRQLDADSYRRGLCYGGSLLLHARSGQDASFYSDYLIHRGGHQHGATSRSLSSRVCVYSHCRCLLGGSLPEQRQIQETGLERISGEAWFISHTPKQHSLRKSRVTVVACLSTPRPRAVAQRELARDLIRSFLRVPPVYVHAVGRLLACRAVASTVSNDQIVGFDTDAGTARKFRQEVEGARWVRE